MQLDWISWTFPTAEIDRSDKMMTVTVSETREVQANAEIATGSEYEQEHVATHDFFAQWVTSTVDFSSNKLKWGSIRRELWNHQTRGLFCFLKFTAKPTIIFLSNDRLGNFKWQSNTPVLRLKLSSCGEYVTYLIVQD